MTTEQFAVLLESLLKLMKLSKQFSHRELYDLYSHIVNETKKLGSFSDWANCIPDILKNWQQQVI